VETISHNIPTAILQILNRRPMSASAEPLPTSRTFCARQRLKANDCASMIRHSRLSRSERTPSDIFIVGNDHSLDFSASAFAHPIVLSSKHISLVMIIKQNTCHIPDQSSCSNPRIGLSSLLQFCRYRNTISFAANSYVPSQYHVSKDRIK